MESRGQGSKVENTKVLIIHFKSFTTILKASSLVHSARAKFDWLLSAGYPCTIHLHFGEELSVFILPACGMRRKKMVARKLTEFSERE